jgi:ketosteroid isomerase-like protein
MIVKTVLVVVVLFATSCAALAQNSNSSTTTPKPRSTTTKPATTTTKPATTKPSATPQRAATTTKPAATSTAATTTTKPKPASTATAASSTDVVGTFNKLLEGIRHASVNEVTSAYWNSPRLALFNNNGTVTKGWDQLRKNRESSYPDVKDVKLEVHDVSVTMLGRDGALVTCLWNQSQTYKGSPESASGRMTLVFKRVSGEWKVIHLHTSPDKEDPSRVMPSEQTPAAKPSPSPSPTP